MDVVINWDKLEAQLIELGENCDGYALENVVNTFYQENIEAFKHFHSTIWTSDCQDRYCGFDLWDGLIGKEVLHRYHVYESWNNNPQWKNDKMQPINSKEDREELIKKLKSLVGQSQHAELF